MRGSERRAADEKKEATIRELTQWILAYVEQNTAGSATDERVKWTHLRYCDLTLHLEQTYRVAVTTECVNVSKGFYTLRVIGKGSRRRVWQPGKVPTGASNFGSFHF